MYFSYDLGEWLHDWGVLSEATHTIEKENYPAWVRNFFRSHYANLSEADWKMERQRKARAYVEKHLDALESHSLVIASTQSVVISKELVFALFQFFSHATDEQVVDEPPPEIIISEAKEHQRRWGNKLY